jgi:hypothetical protein
MWREPQSCSLAVARSRKSTSCFLVRDRSSGHLPLPILGILPILPAALLALLALLNPILEVVCYLSRSRIAVACTHAVTVTVLDSEWIVNNVDILLACTDRSTSLDLVMNLAPLAPLAPLTLVVFVVLLTWPPPSVLIQYTSIRLHKHTWTIYTILVFHCIYYGSVLGPLY